MKVTNFRRAYGDRFRSLPEIKNRLESLERRRNGRNGHNRDYRSMNESGKFKSPYPEVKMPSLEFVAVLFVEHPYLTGREIAGILRRRVGMRHYFPDKYKTTALARGEVYLPDEMEEFREDMLDSIGRERLRRVSFIRGIWIKNLDHHTNSNQGSNRLNSRRLR